MEPIEDHNMIADPAQSCKEESIDHGQDGQFMQSQAGNIEMDTVPVLHVLAKDMLEPLIPLMPVASAPYLQDNALFILVAAVALLLLVITAVVKLLLHSLRPKTLVLYGPMEAGKTTLLHSLQGIAPPQGTVSSMKANEAVVTLPGTNKVVKVVDVPGHPRLRSLYDLHASSASFIVFILDSASFVADKQLVAEQLHQVLQQQASTRRGCRVIVACNKADLEERAFSQDFIVRQLEKAINSFRASKGAEVPGAVGRKDSLGDTSAPFTFSTSIVPVRVCTISAATANLQGLVDALEGR
eukprot:jgi/Ulvmu1/7174/UM034_0083.1